MHPTPTQHRPLPEMVRHSEHPQQSVAALLQCDKQCTVEELSSVINLGKLCFRTSGRWMVPLDAGKNTIYMGFV